MNTGERVRYLRKDLLHLTLEKFGDRLGVGKTAISKIEVNYRSLSNQMLKSICREYGVSEEWLRNGTGEPFGSINQELSSLMNQLLSEDDSSFKKKFAFSILKMSDDKWKLLEAFCENLIEKDG